MHIMTERKWDGWKVMKSHIDSIDFSVMHFENLYLIMTVINRIMETHLSTRKNKN